ncbi:MAG: hypothetical protein H6815_06025 [Phycisphaeraceae bacterium]|nr:hypothetical protein [Phycisphaerales bacterium]MCB9859997.1 hypothetical protein [Phycisphaeraceae bacterium]
MEPTPSREDELARLCNRAQALVREHAWLGDEIRAAFLAFMELSKRFGAKTTEIEQHRQRQIRELLTTKGRLVDPETRKGGIAWYDYFDGLCPTELDKCLRETSRYEVLPRKLERKAAAAAHAAWDWNQKHQSSDTTPRQRRLMEDRRKRAVEANTHVIRTWEVTIVCPFGGQEPANPYSFERTELQRFPDADFHTIALYRVGGLADAGSLRPTMPEAPSTGQEKEDGAAYVTWRHRLPILEEDFDENLPGLNPRAFPPDILEQMLDYVEKWVSNGEPNMDTSQGAQNESDAVGSSVPALTSNQSQVLRTMARFDASCLLFTKTIEEEMDQSIRLSERTIGPIVQKLIELHYAERPEGDRKGARLTIDGRKLASKIAD